MQVTRQKNRCDGLAIIEVAIVTPLLLLLIMGVVHFGWLFLRAHHITHAAREGARVAIRYGATNADVMTTISNWMNSTGMGSSGYQVTISPAAGSASVGQSIRVKITVPAQNLAILDLSIFNVVTPQTIGAAATMAKEGF